MKVVGLTREQAYEKFGFLLDAYRFASPPHAGIGIGLDRVIMLMGGRDSIRDTIAFPKTASATNLMDGSPSPIEDVAMKELGIKPSESARWRGRRRRSFPARVRGHATQRVLEAVLGRRVGAGGAEHERPAEVLSSIAQRSQRFAQLLHLARHLGLSRSGAALLGLLEQLGRGALPLGGRHEYRATTVVVVRTRVLGDRGC